jgi:hypothetical protein
MWEIVRQTFRDDIGVRRFVTIFPGYPKVDDTIVVRTHGLIDEESYSLV